MTNSRIIVLEDTGSTLYWSHYGNFTAKRDDAKEFSEAAAKMKVDEIHKLAKRSGEYSQWANARVEWAELVTF